jgi:hypothetical protein
VLTDPLPKGSKLVSVTSTQGICLVVRKALTCNLDTLANGGTAVVTVKRLGETDNLASVSANEPDPDSANNVAQAASTVLPSQKLKVRVRGAGIVTSEPAGIDCPKVCRAEYITGTTVRLDALPSPGWTKGCSGTDPCFIDMARAARSRPCSSRARDSLAVAPSIRGTAGLSRRAQ